MCDFLFVSKSNCVRNLYVTATNIYIEMYMHKRRIKELNTIIN